MAKSRISTAELTIQVRREVAVMKALRHKNIVRLYEVLTSSKHIYLVMELVTGGELFDIISDRGRLSEAEARTYFQQLVCGIDYCHRRLVYHRDLKPENLMLGEDGALKIVDFGLSSIKSANSGTELLHTVCGTPHYTSPEVITSAKNGYDGAKFDVWSSGIILYGMLCGFLPFDEDSERALYDAIVKDKLIFPSHLSVGVKELLSGMLEKDPVARWSFGDVKKHPWFLVGFVGEELDMSVPVSSAPLPAGGEEEDEEARRRRRRKGRTKKKRLDTVGRVSSDRSNESQDFGGAGSAESGSIPDPVPVATVARSSGVAGGSGGVDSGPYVKALSARTADDRRAGAGLALGCIEAAAQVPPGSSLSRPQRPCKSSSHRHRSGRSQSPTQVDRRASPPAVGGGVGRRGLGDPPRGSTPCRSGGSSGGSGGSGGGGGGSSSGSGAAKPHITPRGKRKGDRAGVGHTASAVARDALTPAEASLLVTSPIRSPGSALSPTAEGGDGSGGSSGSLGAGVTGGGRRAPMGTPARLFSPKPAPVAEATSPFPAPSVYPSMRLIQDRLAAVVEDLDAVLDESDADSQNLAWQPFPAVGRGTAAVRVDRLGGSGGSGGVSLTERRLVAADSPASKAMAAGGGGGSHGGGGGSSVAGSGGGGSAPTGAGSRPAAAASAVAAVAAVAAADGGVLRFVLPPEGAAAVARNRNPLLSRLRGRTPGVPAAWAATGAPRLVID
ncbi:hypothetical protein MMPV_005475 [Pyropia vietnamensis]